MLAFLLAPDVGGALSAYTTMEFHSFETKIGDTPFSVDINRLAFQAGGSVMATFGKTVVHATATMSAKPREGAGWFPLTVDFEEKYYAVGKIKGSRFIKREGRPTTEAILSARLTDRCMRPLFPKGMTNEVQIVVTVLSFDKENDPDIVGLLATSIALAVSDIPWDGPLGAVRVDTIDGQKVVNPTYEQRAQSTSSIVLAGKKNQVNMIEADGQEASEDEMIDNIEAAMQPMNDIIEFQEKIVAELKPVKREVPLNIPNADVVKFVQEQIEGKLEPIVFTPDHIESKPKLTALVDAVQEATDEKFGDDSPRSVFDIIDEEIGEMIVSKALTEDRRADGRAFDEVRELEVTVGLLPVPHGSGMFRRGLTQVMSVITLGSPGDEEHLDGMEIEGTRNYIHYYNFPPYAPGETGFMRGPGRRELGHGALAEKALLPVLPSKEEFPYTMIIMSECLSSNGSTSMAATCGSTLALMDAGVPIKKPVGGIAMGLIYESESNYKILTDIQGAEDHSGHMDFKVAGTRDGITALQMDVKVEGLPIAVLKEALEHAKKARLHILDTMGKTLPEPRAELSATAPRVIIMTVPTDKIRDIIGSGGETINKIIDETGAKIDIEDDGTVFITGENKDSSEEAKKIIEGIIREYEVGEEVTGPVVSMLEFGAFIEFAPKKKGLVHVSELSDEFVKNVEDVVKVGDTLTAKIIKIDEKGRYNLSVKALKKTEDKNDSPKKDKEA